MCNEVLRDWLLDLDEDAREATGNDAGRPADPERDRTD